MILVSSIYNDVLDLISKDQNGEMDFSMFNRMSKRAEVRLLDFLTGNVTGQKPPVSFSNQKTRDFLSPIMKDYKTGLDNDGKFTKPTDYYYYDNMYSLIAPEACEEPEDCDADVDEAIGKYVITLLSGDRFNQRKDTYISGLKPTPKKAIAKEVGAGFEVYPNVAGVVLEYVSTPVFAKIVGTIDPTYNTPVVNENTSTNYTWDEGVRELLVYFLGDAFYNHISLQSGKQMSNASNATVAGS